MPVEDTYYQIALTLVRGIGPILGKALVDHFKSAKAIFQATEEELIEHGQIHAAAARAIKDFNQFARVKKTLAFIEKHGIQTLFLSDLAYPKRLLDCPDPPTLLYYKGTVPFCERYMVSIVGTRTPTDYGKQLTRELLRGLSVYNPLVVSGLADGIDTLVHRHALDYGLSTIGVLGHGMDTIYPPGNRLLAKEIIHQGGLISEYREGVPAAKYNFPRRNRIVAGISEAVVIVETAVKGGSIVTASLAHGYHRDVFAFPGRTTDLKSIGCNTLIRQNKAAIVTSAADIAYYLDWEKPGKSARKDQRGSAQASGQTDADAIDSRNSQTGAGTTAPSEPANAGPRFPEGSPERHLCTLLSQSPSPLHIDALIAQTGMGASTLAALLLSLELDGSVESLPGMRYRLRP